MKCNPLLNRAIYQKPDQNRMQNKRVTDIFRSRKLTAIEDSSVYDV